MLLQRTCKAEGSIPIYYVSSGIMVMKILWRSLNVTFSHLKCPPHLFTQAASYYEWRRPMQTHVVDFVIFKGALSPFGEGLLIRRERSSLTDIYLYLTQTKWTNSLCFHDWINKLTIKDSTVSYCFTLLICGGPCHLSSFKVLTNLFSSENSLFFHW